MKGILFREVTIFFDFCLEQLNGIIGEEEMRDFTKLSNL